MSMFDMEVKTGHRFEFGKNWRSFLTTLTDDKIKIAQNSIQEMLQIDDLNGKTVLDIGCGSGLFSLAARNLGARVHSFDYDPASVACTKELRSLYFSNESNWIIQEGSILDKNFLKSLDNFDIVYSWGVLHHTGCMWSAIENAASLVKIKGTLFLAIYNDQGILSMYWKKVKKLYCSGLFGKTIVCCLFIPCLFSIALLSCILKRENVFSLYKQNRGMSLTHDWFDWIGGFPFEVATVEAVFHFLHERGFLLNNIETTNGLGNNQYVFFKESDS